MRYFARAFVIEVPHKAVQPRFAGQRARISIRRAEAFIRFALLLFLGEVADDFAGSIENIQRNLRRFGFLLRIGFRAAFCFVVRARRLRAGIAAVFFLRIRFFQRGLQPVIDDCSCATASLYCSSGVMLSSTQKLRPCVATTRSLFFTTKSFTGETGRFSCSGCQCSPSSKETYTPASVPAKSKPACLGSTRTACT